MIDPIVVLSTCATEEEAAKLARALVEERLAACVNVIPEVRSYYRWEGAVESSTEVLLVIKSSAVLLYRLREWLESHHSYAVPEILALPVAGGAPKYLQWLAASLVEPKGE